MTIEKTVPLEQELVNIFGVNDQNLNYLKSLFPDLEINVRGNIIYINGSNKDTKEATRILDEMLLMNDLKKKWHKKRDRMLKDKDDVNDSIINLIDETI